jgi:5-methylcytosine-specific restriction endonuclease McrA
MVVSISFSMINFIAIKCLPMILPLDEQISVAKLASVFNNTVATYKFYWFLSIIEASEEGMSEIPKRALFARMISLSWYTIHYFHVSFGKQDLLQQASQEIRFLENINVDERKEGILHRIIQSSSDATGKLLDHFDKNVPHKFLSPWLGSGPRSEVEEMSRSSQENPPYALRDKNIVVYPNWYEYFRRNSAILKNFCYWNLALFLQARNPNVPDIPAKIIKPVQRRNMSTQKRNFWDMVIQQNGPFKCIYTGKNLGIGAYDIDHFIPFQYVSHDLMWNLIPADPVFNTAKSDRLPSMERFFDDFFDIHRKSVDTIRKVDPRNRFLEDYLSIFPSLTLSRSRLRDTIQPMLSIAHNNGFQYMT